jgi:hypothetical protein
MNLGLQISSPVRRSGQEAQCIPLALLFYKEGGLDSGTSSLSSRVKTWCPFELLMSFSVRAGPWFPFNRDPTEVASDRPLTLNDWFNRVTRVIRPSPMARCLFLIKYPRPVFIKTRTWIEESHMVLGATRYWPLVCHSSFHPSLYWLGATVETPSQGQPMNSRARFGPCANDAT